MTRKNPLHLLIITMLLLCNTATLCAQVGAKNRVEICVNFPFPLTKIYKHYGENSESLAQINHLLDSIDQDPHLSIQSVEFIGSASPDGQWENNNRIALARLRAIEDYVREHVHMPDSIVTHTNLKANWEEAIELIRNSDLPRKQEVLDIIDSVPEHDRINALKQLDNKVWNTLFYDIFPKVRKACAVIITVVEYEDKALPSREVKPLEVSIVAATPLTPVEADIEERQVVATIKTNAVYLSSLIVNLGTEIRLTPHLSLDIAGMYSPYDLIVRDRKIRVFAAQPELRYWFRESMTRGHFVGLHGLVSAFNVQVADRLRFQDPNRPFWGVGLSYGYMLPLSRRWQVEFTVGVGYANVVYDIYEGRENGKLIEQGAKYHYFGPTKVGVDFAYCFDINKKRLK